MRIIRVRGRGGVKRGNDATIVTPDPQGPPELKRLLLCALYHGSGAWCWGKNFHAQLRDVRRANSEH